MGAPGWSKFITQPGITGDGTRVFGSLLRNEISHLIRSECNGFTPTVAVLVCTCTADNPAILRWIVLDKSLGPWRLRGSWYANGRVSDRPPLRWISFTSRWPRIPCSCLMSRNLASLVLCNIGCIMYRYFQDIFRYFSYSVCIPPFCIMYFISFINFIRCYHVHIVHYQWIIIHSHNASMVSSQLHAHQKEPTVNGRMLTGKPAKLGVFAYVLFKLVKRFTLHIPDQ